VKADTLDNVLSSDSNQKENQEKIEVITADIPDEAIEYAKSVLATQTSIMFSLGEGNSNISRTGDISLGNGYYTYSYENEILVQNEVIEFPVIQNDKVV